MRPTPLHGRWIILTMCLCLMGTGSATHAQSNDSARNWVRFEVPGAPEEVNATLARTLAAQPAPAITDGGIDPADDERRLRRLREDMSVALATEGYFSPSIHTRPDPSERTRFVLAITLGPRTTIASVDIEFQGPIASEGQRVQRLRDGWTLPVGQAFRDARWSNAKTHLLLQVTEKDYAAARIVDSSATVDVAKAQVALKVQIDSGPPFKYGALQIEGLNRYQPDLIERLAPPQEGEPYNAEALLAFQRRLQATVFFTSAIVSVEPDPAMADAAPVLVDVSEAKRKRLQLGAGYSTDTGPRLEATYRQALVFDRPLVLQSGLGVDQKRSIFYSDLILPPRPSGAVHSVGGLFERADIENVVTHRWGAGAARLTVQAREAASIETKLSVKLQRELRRFTDAPDLPSETNDVLSTTWSWTRRAVDELTDPRRGTVLGYALTAGLRREFIDSLAANTFVRGWLRAKVYLPFPGLDPTDNVLILRGELGRVFVDNPSFVPNEFLFRTGGADSLRGYAYQSIGRPPGSARAGSTALAISSIEAVHWFGPQWGGALFFDIGDAADDFDQMRKPARAAGVGVRWKTLAGPIAFDFAYGERRADNTGGRWRLHFSVAIAF